MPYKIKTEQFHGPLALLLQLIEQQRLDIANVSLSQVADQYLARIDELGDQLPTDELADFLVIAGRLLVIKSRALLPIAGLDEESEGDLEYQLKMYKAYRDAAEGVRALLAHKRFSFSRLAIKPAQAMSFSPPEKLTARLCANSMRVLLAALEQYAHKTPREKMQKVISLRDRIMHLRALVQSQSGIFFHDFLKSARSRAEVVVSFLAVLEMVKQRELVAEQDGDGIIMKSIAEN